MVEGTIPAQLREVEVSCRGENGAHCGTGSSAQGLYQPVDLPKGSKIMITLSGTIDSHYEGSLTCTSLVKSPTCGEHGRAAVRLGQDRGRIAPDQRRLPDHQAMVADLARERAGWVISYELILAANEQRVVMWEISFDVPPRTRIKPSGTR